MRISDWSSDVCSSDLELHKRVAGTVTTISNPASAIANTSQIWLRVQVLGTRMRVRAWADGGAEPSTWTIDTTDTQLTSGTLGGIFVRREAGNTTPTSISFDSLTATTMQIGRAHV